MAASVWILILSVFKIYPAAAVNIFQSESFVSTKPGEAVTLRCTLGDQEKKENVFWYKQPPGEKPQELGISKPMSNELFSSQLNNSSFKLERAEHIISLIITHPTQEDEGTYYCGLSVMNVLRFSTGTYLAVTGDPQVNISVVQSPERGSVSPGEEVTLQCSVFSQIKAAELTVLWVRAAAGQSFPQIISTGHSSSSRPQCENRSSSHSCVSNFTKNITHRSNRAATYYCAVEVCGRVVFGNGTVVERDPSSTAVVVVLAVALCLCVIWNITLCYICVRGRMWDKRHPVTPDLSKPDRPRGQHSDDAELNYAALRFTERKTERGKKTRRKDPEDSVYSAIRTSSRM